ncbi:MAG TPA: hypothetical protein HPP83_09125, partial [Candidatus Hydrogenedentes bacterium]|nr:hypothetical protein [Candidatus Hydrogenedentota bacterium]
MRHSIPKLGKNEGTALLLAVGYVGAVSMLAAALLAALGHTITVAGKEEARQIAVAIAEAGIDKAVAELRAAPNTYRGEKQTQLGD